MSDDRTTVVVERYLIALAGDMPSDPVVRALLDPAGCGCSAPACCIAAIPA